MKKFIYIFLFLNMSALLCAQQPKADAKKTPGKEAAIQNVAVKKVTFNPNRRNPFLSKEEVIQIEQERKARQRKAAEEAAARERQLKAEREKLLKQKIWEEEMRRYPARAVMYKLHVDGILGSEAIVNGEVVSIGSKVLGATVVSITDDSVWFTYKGQRFQRKLPLL